MAHVRNKFSESNWPRAAVIFLLYEEISPKRRTRYVKPVRTTEAVSIGRTWLSLDLLQIRMLYSLTTLLCIRKISAVSLTSLPVTPLFNFLLKLSPAWIYSGLLISLKNNRRSLLNAITLRVIKWNPKVVIFMILNLANIVKLQRLR